MKKKTNIDKAKDLLAELYEVLESIEEEKQAVAISHLDNAEGTKQFRLRVAERLKTERNRMGLTQKEFAKIVDLSNQTYNNLETAKGSLKIEYLYNISKVTGCDIGYLLCDYDVRNMRR